MTHTDLLRQALERMDRARAILTDFNPRLGCYWGMLDTTDIRAALAAPVEPVAMGVPVGWIDEFGNVFPLGAWVRSEVREKWKPLYATPQAQPDLIPPDALFVCGQMGANVTRVRAESAAPAVNCEWTNCPRRVGDVCCNDRPAAPAVPAVREPVTDPDCEYWAPEGQVCIECLRIHRGITGDGK